MIASHILKYKDSSFKSAKIASKFLSLASKYILMNEQNFFGVQYQPLIYKSKDTSIIIPVEDETSNSSIITEANFITNPSNIKDEQLWNSMLDIDMNHVISSKYKQKVKIKIKSVSKGKPLKFNINDI